ncbi:hypothetical protein DWV63_06205 [Enterococcus durans]|nr:hypothetical protein DWV63_06205 [Enterococcus durans]
MLWEIVYLIGGRRTLDVRLLFYFLIKITSKKTFTEIKLIYFYKNVEISFHSSYTLFIEMKTDTQMGEKNVWIFDFYE